MIDQDVQAAPTIEAILDLYHLKSEEKLELLEPFWAALSRAQRMHIHEHSLENAETRVLKTLKDFILDPQNEDHRGNIKYVMAYSLNAVMQSSMDFHTGLLGSNGPRLPSAPKEEEGSSATAEEANVTYRILGDRIGYVRLKEFDAHSDLHIDQAIKDIQVQLSESKADGLGYVLDLRNNGGGLLDQAVEILNNFIDGEADIDASYHVQSQGFETFSDTLKRNILVAEMNGAGGIHTSFFTKPGDDIDGAPLVVLINHGSASASEIVSLSLQRFGRATLIGMPSFGKGTVQVVQPIQGLGLKGQMKTTKSYYVLGPMNAQTPKGISIQGSAVMPDIHAPFDAASETLERTLPYTLPAPEGLENRRGSSQKCVIGDDEADLSLLDDDKILACAVAYLEKSGNVTDPLRGVFLKPVAMMPAP